MKLITPLLLIASLASLHAKKPLELEEIHYLNVQAHKGNRLPASPFFKSVSAPFAYEKITTNSNVLLNAAKEALAHLTSQKGMAEYEYIIRNNYKHLAQNPDFVVQDLFTAKAQQTLRFVINVIESDNRHRRPSRILDTDFLNRHFDFISWIPDTESAQKRKVDLPDDGQIRITKYAVFKAKGSSQKTKEYTCALYNFTKEEHADVIRFKYTKQEVVDGILEKNHKNHIKPLVWLTRDGLEEALLQGTICIEMPDKKQKFFTVDKNNGIAYDQTIKEKTLQKRYWYFKEITDMKNNPSQSYVINHGTITIAGDLYNIGLGKLIALKYENPVTGNKDIKLGVLVDTGGAFTNNLFQLDLYCGIFDTRDDLFAQTREFPQYAHAYILVKKS